MATNKEMLQEILDLLRANLEATKRLDERRRKDRLRKSKNSADFQGSIPRISTERSAEKEERAEIKEISPHTPYIENKGEKEVNSRSLACAGARDVGEIFPVSDGIDGVEYFDPNTGSRFIQQRPKLEFLLKPKNHHVKRYSEEVIRAWYDEMLLTDWSDKNNNPVKNWKYDLMQFAAYYAKHKAEQDPNRVPDANKPKRIQIEHINQDRKACNWRGTRKENIGHALG